MRDCRRPHEGRAGERSRVRRFSAAIRSLSLPVSGRYGLAAGKQRTQLRVTRAKVPSIRFSSLKLRTLWMIGVGVWLSGGLWMLFHYFLTKQGEFGPTSNPLEPWLLKLHGAFAFAAIWLFGLVWGTHMAVAWPIRRRRLSGSLFAAAISWLVLSGYLLYYTANETARSVVSLSHGGIGLALPLLYWAHRIKKGQGQEAGKSARSRADNRLGEARTGTSMGGGIR